MTEVSRLEKPKPRKKPKKQSLLKQADTLCGQIVRARGRCENCGATKELQWAHGFSRSYRKIRHDLRNGICLCKSCHMRFTVNPLGWDDWLRDYWGEQLYWQMRMYATEGPKADLKATIELLKAQVEK